MNSGVCSHQWTMVGDDACVCAHCQEVPSLWVIRPDGTPDVLYWAQPYQRPYHESALPNLIMVGPRGTGKSTILRNDAHMRAMAIPGFKYLVVRRTTPELKRSHLVYIQNEMHRLGGDFHSTDSQARYPNGSIGWYGHAEDEASIMRYLSSEYDLLILDEVTTFSAELVLRLMSCVRVPEGSGRIGMLRGGTNPLGVGAEFVRKFFIEKTVPPEDNPDYNPDDWGVIEHKFTDNQYLDQDQYRKRLSNLPEHVRRAWLEGEWVVEGVYFPEFRPFKAGEPWHVILEIPVMRGASVIGQPWVNIYRAIDWGYSPDPAVCLWIAVLPNRRTIVFKERTWKSTLATDVAKAIKRESEGMRVVETFCDPTMTMNDGKGVYSIGDIFEQHGIPLTPSVNKRDQYGYALHEYLNTLIDDTPQLQIVAEQGGYGCPHLIKTIPQLQIDPHDPTKIADGHDHWAIALAYFCMGKAVPGQSPDRPTTPRWMLPKAAARAYYVV